MFSKCSEKTVSVGALRKSMIKRGRRREGRKKVRIVCERGKLEEVEEDRSRRGGEVLDRKENIFSSFKKKKESLSGEKYRQK